MRYYAHSSQGPSQEWQMFADHANGVADRAAEFLHDFGLGGIACAWGLLHDVGKVTREFQDILTGGRQRFDHSAPGARIALDRYGRLGRLLAPGVAGHHAGMADWSMLESRLDRAKAPDQAWEGLVDIPSPASLIEAAVAGRFGDAFACQLLTRMLFSAGVDADYLDTEAYYDRVAGRSRQRGGYPPLDELRDRLAEHLDSMSDSRSEMNQLRREVLRRAREAASSPQGVFTMTVPTGGGKTLSSLAFALDHALRHGLQRVIYVAPFMSIIDQTVGVFRRALQGGDFVVEHHSTFDDRRLGRDDSADRHRLSMQNWDAPVVCTTYVQFMESLFSNRPSRCRKLHNVANSVVILDEPQSLPIIFLRPCVAALKELARVWRTTVLQCTATPPALAENDGFEGGFVNVCELAPDPRALHGRTRRRTTVHVEDVVRGDRTSDIRLVQRLGDHRQVLCIVNSRRHARKLRGAVDGEGAFHLSASMCPAHRQAVLEDVKAALWDGTGIVRLIATPVVEAGVDIDFPVVYRALAGLESIIQSAGRCNREGRLDAGDVFVFEPEPTRDSRAPYDIHHRGGIARNVLRRSEDPTALDTFRTYCSRLYWIADDGLDGKQILRKIAEGGRRLEFPFEEIADDFKLIDTNQQPIVVPWGNAERLLRDLEHESSARRVALQLQPYVVQISPSSCARLIEARDAWPFRKDEFGDRFVVLSNAALYRHDVGLVTD